MLLRRKKKQAEDGSSTEGREDESPSAEVASIVQTLTPRDLDRLPKTDAVLVAPSVITDLLGQAALYRRNEIGTLLLGRERGRFLIVEKAVAPFNVGSAVDVKFTPRDFERARAQARNGQITIGWAHSHPTYAAYMSEVDVRHQSQSEQLYPDYVGLVIDPFRPDGVQFKFFRTRDGRSEQVPHHFWRSEP